MKKKRVENFQHTSDPTLPNLKMNYSLLVEMPNPPQTAQNTYPISSSMLLLNVTHEESMLLQNPNAPKCSQMMNERGVRHLEGSDRVI
jgi:hypothetical protein